MNKNELNVATTCILALANQPKAEEKIKLLLTNLFDGYSKTGYIEQETDEIESGSVPLLFTQKELEKMPKPYNKTFKTRETQAHVHKVRGVYEIRCYVYGVRISASSKSLETAKKKLILKIKDMSATTTQKVQIATGTMFNDYMETWLETAKKPYVKEVTYKDYTSTFNVHIRPVFEGRTLTSVKYAELQKLILEYEEDGKNRTAKKIYQLLTTLFEFAVADRIIPISPMLKVKLSPYEQESGQPLTRDEERALVEDFKNDPTLYKQAFVFLLYTGLRRSELASVNVSDGWVTLISAKQRKGYKEKERALPISPMLRELLPLIDVDAIKKVSPHLLTKQLPFICKGHHCHELRHTFVTRARECKIEREYVSLWVGHKADNSLTTNVYTKLQQNTDLQVDEMKKFSYAL